MTSPDDIWVRGIIRDGVISDQDIAAFLPRVHALVLRVGPDAARDILIDRTRHGETLERVLDDLENEPRWWS